MFKRMKNRIDQRNAEYLATLPPEEAEEILEASQTFRGTIRLLWRHATQIQEEKRER